MIIGKSYQFTNEKRPIVVFDMDGTLVETDEANSAAYKRALRNAGIGSTKGLTGRISATVIRKSFPLLGMSEMNEIIRQKVSTYRHELWRTQLGPAAEALSWVVANRSRFGKLVLLTDSSGRRALETLRYHQLDALFDEIVCNGGRGDKYINYFKDYDSDPAACIVWEDESGMVQSAIAAGVKFNNIRKVA